MIVFYDSPHKVWFNKKHRKGEIRTSNYILSFLSNYDEWLKDFNKDENLKLLVNSWLSIDSKNADKILYIPYEMKEKLIQIIQQILNNLGLKMKLGDIAFIPTSKQLGLGKEDARTDFYDSMTIKDVHVLTEANDMDEIQELFDEITSGDTDVDAVFLTRTDNAPKPILKGSTRENVTINMDRYGSLIQKFLEYVNRTSKVTPGFKNAIFEFNPAITSIVLVGNKQKHLLFFVSETGKDQANFLNSRDEYLPQIKQLLLNAGKIDEIN